ncbi:hypothetical protein FOZ62_004208, partial [Perkinsus olseni]
RRVGGDERRRRSKTLIAAITSAVISADPKEKLVGRPYAGGLVKAVPTAEAARVGGRIGGLQEQDTVTDSLSGEASVEQDAIMHRMKAVHPGAVEPTWPGQLPQAIRTTTEQRTGVLEASEQLIAETCAVHTAEHTGTNSGEDSGKAEPSGLISGTVGSDPTVVHQSQMADQTRVADQTQAQVADLTQLAVQTQMADQAQVAVQRQMADQAQAAVQ